MCVKEYEMVGVFAIHLCMALIDYGHFSGQSYMYGVARLALPYCYMYICYLASI